MLFSPVPPLRQSARRRWFPVNGHVGFPPARRGFFMRCGVYRPVPAATGTAAAAPQPPAASSPIAAIPPTTTSAIDAADRTVSFGLSGAVFGVVADELASVSAV